MWRQWLLGAALWLVAVALMAVRALQPETSELLRAEALQVLRRAHHAPVKTGLGMDRKECLYCLRQAVDAHPGDAHAQIGLALMDTSPTNLEPLYRLLRRYGHHREVHAHFLRYASARLRRQLFADQVLIVEIPRQPLRTSISAGKRLHQLPFVEYWSLYDLVLNWFLPPYEARIGISSSNPSMSLQELESLIDLAQEADPPCPHASGKVDACTG